MTLTSEKPQDCAAAFTLAAVNLRPTQRLGDLLEGIAAGQQDCLAALYDATAARVFGVSCAVLRNASLAEEVTQDVFLEIWQRARRFDPAKGTALSWLLRLSHSRAVDKVRHHQALSRLDHLDAVTSYRPDVDNVLHDILAAQQRSELHNALQSMTPRQRQAITLTFFAGYSYPQASALLGVPLPTLKTRIRDGLINLRTALELADQENTRRPQDPRTKVGQSPVRRTEKAGR